MDDRLAVILRALPKAELHRHLPGSLRLQTMLDLAQEYALDLPANDVEGLRRYAQVSSDTPANLAHILGTVSAFLQRFFASREATTRLAYEMVEDAWRDGIVYLEIRFSPWYLGAVHGLGFEDVVEAVAQGVAGAQRRYPVRTGILLGMTREAGVEVAERVCDYAIGLSGALGVVGVDLSGDEAGHPPELFARPLQRVQAAGGLGITVHAGEASGPESVRAAIELLGAGRIGHGVRVVHDPAVVDLVRSRGIVLETCPTSNVRTGAVPGFERHPLAALLRQGVVATINTDDPSWFDITLTGEYEVALTRLGLTVAELRQAAVNAAAGAFLPAAERSELVAQIGDAYADLGV